MTGAQAVRHGTTLNADPRRVIVKLFVPGEDAAVVRTRAAALIERVAHLDDEETGTLLRDIFSRFGARHRDLDGTFHHHYDLVRHRAARVRDLSPTARLLIGAYFSHEYAVEAAALCNPSMVAHPDQTGLGAGQLRVAISLRQIGEGHLSSIGFATALLGPERRLAVADRSGPLVVGERMGVRHRRDLLAAGLTEVDCDNEITASVLEALPERYDGATFERVLGDLPPDLLSRSTGPGTIEHLRRTSAVSYATTFPADTGLHQRVLWPATPAESNGLEDARFVRFVGESGPVYRATYTAYDGRRIATRALASGDLRRFENPRQLMAYVGLVPSEHSSGDRRRMGSITKAGNARVRHILVQAAWSYRRRPTVGAPLKRRQQGQDSDVIRHAWKCQHRLYTLFHRLAVKKPRQVAATAVARELVGFLWAVLRDIDVASLQEVSTAA